MAESTGSLARPAAPAPSGAWRSRRRFLAGLGLTAGGLAVAAQFGPDWGAGAPARAPSAPPRTVPAVPVPPVVQYGAEPRAAWAAFRQRYVTPDGRVVDSGNGNVSHSEGQGWGLFGAQACDDPQSFASILDWTTRTLQRRPSDCLHSWRFRPADRVPVADPNNATDGDLFIAAALARAAARWHRPDYAERAAALAEAILALVRTAGARTVLLPGAVGFEAADSFTVNPSYYAFALLDDLAALAPSEAWARVRAGGVGLVEDGRFGRWALPPDWLRVGRHDGGLSIAPGWPPRFSYDAIRVPLHLAWSGLVPDARARFAHYWASSRAPAAWVDLSTGEVAPYAAPAGLCAVASLTMPTNLGKTVLNGAVKSAGDYYSAGLTLLSLLAARDSQAAG